MTPASFLVLLSGILHCYWIAARDPNRDMRVVLPRATAVTHTSHTVRAVNAARTRLSGRPVC